MLTEGKKGRGKVPHCVPLFDRGERKEVVTSLVRSPKRESLRPSRKKREKYQGPPLKHKKRKKENITLSHSLINSVEEEGGKRVLRILPVYYPRRGVIKKRKKKSSSPRGVLRFHEGEKSKKEEGSFVDKKKTDILKERKVHLLEKRENVQFPTGWRKSSGVYKERKTRVPVYEAQGEKGGPPDRYPGVPVAKKRKKRGGPGWSWKCQKIKPDYRIVDN